MPQPSMINGLWILAAGFLAGFGWTWGGWLAGRILHRA
jgi:hypothetical protein